MTTSPLLNKAYQDAAASERRHRAGQARLATEARSGTSERRGLTTTRRHAAVRPILALLSRLA
jgi:hypothetical protein